MTKPQFPEDSDDFLTDFYAGRHLKPTIIHERSKGFWRTYWPAMLFLLGCGGLAWLAASNAWGGHP